MISARLCKLLQAGSSVALATLLAACAAKGNNPVTAGNSGKIFAVTADTTSFYRYGPQQGNGADQQLPQQVYVAG